MEEFLKFTKQANLDAGKEVHAVIGNEACDLDSAVSAFVYAFFLHSRSATQSTVHLPILNIPRADLPLRMDIRHVLRENRIPEDLLTFRNEVNLERLAQSGKLSMTLVDFNVFPNEADRQTLDGAVVEVIDHRPRERPTTDRAQVTMELVGSCCTLITEKLLANKFTFPPQIVHMLYCAILVDTVCLSDMACRKMPKDDAIVAQLEAFRPDLDRRKTFDDLELIRRDTSTLTALDLLRKDLKVVSSDGPPPHTTLPISAILEDQQVFLKRPHLEADLAEFAQMMSSEALLLMFQQITSNGDLLRQLAVFSANEPLRQRICQVLIESTSPCLELNPVPVSYRTISAFTQANFKASRKAVLPIVKSKINSFRTPPSGTQQL